MARSFQESTYKEHSEHQSRHLIALSDREVFLLQSLMKPLVTAAIKNKKNVSYTLQIDTGKIAFNLGEKLQDLVNDILRIKPIRTTQEVEKRDDAKNSQ